MIYDATTYIGVDPGKNGVIAWLRGQLREWHKLPLLLNGDADYQAMAEIIATIPRPAGAWIEKPAMGFHAKRSPSTMMKLYGSYIAWCVVLTLAGIPIRRVYARTWQSAFGIAGKRGDTKRQAHKVAVNEFVGQKVPIYAADAIVIAIYGESCGSHSWETIGA